MDQKIFIRFSHPQSVASRSQRNLIELRALTISVFRPCRSIEKSLVVARVNSQSAPKSASKGIGAFESHRYAYVFDTVVPNGKAATGLIKPQPLNKISWSGAKFYLEPPTKLSGTETGFGQEPPRTNLRLDG
jgi:hypothetical protein